MTIGEKLKEARTAIGLSQDEFAGMLNVSRSAVAKWESDNGIPDIENLKSIAKLLNVSLDYLVDDNIDSDDIVIREDIELGDGNRAAKNRKKKEIIKARFSGEKIYLLNAGEKLTKAESFVDNIFLLIDDLPLWGIFDLVKGVNNMDKMFFLIEKEEKYLLVTITDDYLEIKQMKDYEGQRQFKTEEWEFTKHKYTLK